MRWPWRTRSSGMPDGSRSSAVAMPTHGARTMIAGATSSRKVCAPNSFRCSEMEFEIPRGADREYLIVFGVAAIYIGTIPRGEPCVVGASRDLDKTYEAMR